MLEDPSNINVRKVSWGILSVTILVSLAVYVIASWLISPRIGSALSLTNRIAADVLVFFIIVAPAIVIAVLVGKAIPAYRGIPLPNLIAKGFWIAAVFLTILLFGGWYANQNDAVAAQSSSTVPDKSEAENFSDAEAAVEKHGVDMIVESQVGELRKNLPIRNNMVEQIVGISYLKTAKTQIWRHQFAADWKDQAARMFGVSEAVIDQSFASSMQEQTVNTACSVPLTRLFLSKGVTVQHAYYQLDGTLVFTTQVEFKDCK